MTKSQSERPRLQIQQDSAPLLSIERLVTALRDYRQAKPLNGRGPDLYSLWADENAQQKLIDEKVVLSSWQPAIDGLRLIYVGQTGTLSKRASKGSRATLWRRVGEHVSGTIEGSTTRKTVSAIPHIKDKDEEAISDWIRQHLHVVVVPYEDRNTLKHTEETVLRKLDPPYEPGKCV